jgi:hypothetical protein
MTMQFSSNIRAYWLLLKDLDKESKLSLIELLKVSIKKKPKINSKLAQNDDWIDEFYGCWNISSETAEEVITHIENSRTMGRHIETL